MVQKSVKAAGSSPEAPPAPRGRPRAYDPDEALGRATGAFWKAGYSATSLDALSEATGMNRPSLYGAFGDKRALYLATLERYTGLGIKAMQSGLKPGYTLRESLTRVYDAALGFYFPDGETPRGCFLIGTAATESVGDEEVRARLGESLRDFDREFELRFQRAKEEGALPAGADAASLAKVASAILHTLALRSRAGDTRASLRATAQAGIDLVCGAAAPPSKRGVPKPRYK